MTLISRLKEIGKDSFVYGLSQVLSQLIGFLLLPLYTSFLTPADYGVLAMLSLLQVVLPAFVNLGLNNAVFRFYSKCKSDEERLKLIGTAHLLVVFFSTAVVVVLLMFSNPLCVWLTDSIDHHLSFNLMVLTAWFTSMSTIPLVVLKQQRRVKQIAVRSLIGLLINVLVTIFFVVYLEWGVLGSVIGNICGSAIGSVLLIVTVNHQMWRFFDNNQVRSLLKYSLPFVPYFIQAVFMGIIGQYIVKEYVSLEEAGFYSIAWRFALPLVFVLSAFNNSWAAFKFEIRYNDPDPKKSYREIFSFYTVLVTSCWLMVCLWMPEVFKIVIDSKYYPAIKLIPILALVPVIQNVRGMLTTGLEMSESPKWMPLITLFGLVTVIAASFLFIPIWNSLGAAIAVVLGWMVTALVTYFYSQRVYRIDYNVKLLLTLFLFAGLLYIFPQNSTGGILSIVNSLLKSIIVAVGMYYYYKKVSSPIMESKNFLKFRKR